MVEVERETNIAQDLPKTFGRWPCKLKHRSRGISASYHSRDASFRPTSTHNLTTKVRTVRVPAGIKVILMWLRASAIHYDRITLQSFLDHVEPPVQLRRARSTHSSHGKEVRCRVDDVNVLHAPAGWRTSSGQRSHYDTKLEGSSGILLSRPQTKYVFATSDVSS